MWFDWRSQSKARVKLTGLRVLADSSRLSVPHLGPHMDITSALKERHETKEEAYCWVATKFEQELAA